jgi:catalase
MLLQDVLFLEKFAHFDREVILKQCMHATKDQAFWNIYRDP